MDLQVGQIVRALQMDPASVLGRLSNDALLEIQQALGKFLDERFAEDRVEVAVNKDYGGFGLSEAAKADLADKLEEIDLLSESPRDAYAYRQHPALIATIKKLGTEAASGPYASLTIFSIPRHLQWRIDNYDGYESIVIIHPTSADQIRRIDDK